MTRTGLRGLYANTPKAQAASITIAEAKLLAAITITRHDVGRYVDNRSEI